LDKKFPTAWDKMSENLGGDFFDSHCRLLDKLTMMLLRNTSSWFDTGTRGRRRIRSSEWLSGGDAPEEDRLLSRHPVCPAADREPSLSTPAAAETFITRVRRHRSAAILLPGSRRSSRSEDSRTVGSEHQTKRGLSLSQHLETEGRFQFQQSGYGKLTFTCM